MAKAEVIQLVGDAITNFTEVQCLTPRYRRCKQCILLCILKVHKVKFYYHLLCVGNSLLTDLFWLYVNDCYFKDDCLHHIANHKHIAVSAIYEQFCGDCQ